MLFIFYCFKIERNENYKIVTYLANKFPGLKRFTESRFIRSRLEQVRLKRITDLLRTIIYVVQQPLIDDNVTIVWLLRAHFCPSN